jgi:hypothetical protein
MPKPVVAPRGGTRRKGGVRRRGATGTSITPVKVAITAAVVGMAEKSGLLDNLPEVPMIGRKGTVAIAAYFWARHGGGQIARDVCIVACALAGYELGKEGSISG